MKKLLTVLLLTLSFNCYSDTITYGEQCSYGAPISNVYKQQDNNWVIQVYGGSSITGGADILVKETQLVFKGIKGTKSLNDFKLGWQVEDKGFGGRGNTFGQCDMTKSFLNLFQQDVTTVYIIKK